MSFLFVLKVYCNIERVSLNTTKLHIMFVRVGLSCGGVQLKVRYKESDVTVGVCGDFGIQNGAKNLIRSSKKFVQHSLFEFAKFK